MPRPKRFADLNGITALLVEDNDDSQAILTAVLQFCGARPVVVPSAEQGLGEFAACGPDVIICDLALPGADGFSFIRELRAREAREASPCARRGCRPAIAISAFHERFARPTAFRLGFDEYLDKPLNLPLLCQTIGRMLGRRTEPGRPRVRGT